MIKNPKWIPTKRTNANKKRLCVEVLEARPPGASQCFMKNYLRKGEVSD
jgi:hypothetical protein